MLDGIICPVCWNTSPLPTNACTSRGLRRKARTLYVDEELGLDLTNTVYALDSTTIALCLSVFLWAHFRTTKAAVKMHTLLDLRGNIPSFIHISDGKLHDVHALDMLLPEAGAIYVVDRGYVDFARLYVLHQAGAFFVTRAKSNIDAHRVYSAPTDRSTGIICDQAVSVYVLVAIVKKRLDLDASLYTLLQILSVTLFEKMPIHQALSNRACAAKSSPLASLPSPCSDCSELSSRRVCGRKLSKNPA